MRNHLLLGVTLLAVLSVGLSATPEARGATGEIAVAEVDPGWGQATLAGMVHRTIGCLSFPQPPKRPEEPEGPGSPPEWPGGSYPEPWEVFSRCAWIPYATLGPAEKDCSSPDRHWLKPATGVQLIWSGGERTGAGSAQFDLADLPLEYRAAAPLLCLSVVEAAMEPVVCVAVYPSSCPPYGLVGRPFQLDSATLQVRSTGGGSPQTEPMAPAEGVGSLPSIEPGSQPGAVAQRPRKRCRKGKAKAGARRSRSQSGRSGRCGRLSGAGHRAGSRN
jgi:hypothetical protein